ncbi:MAG: benzoate-CoA ligase family protein [Gammaproteobacteria bacterium]|nr:benzoate-CoA ligase family protein [Gammaproteobacteria bacterium]
MATYSKVNRECDPPQIALPRIYNAASEFVDRHIEQGRGERIAFIDDQGEYTYRSFAERVNRAGNALLALGVRMEDRVLMCMLDTIDFPAVFWGAIKIGAIPIPVNTLLTAHDYDYMMRDSRARVLVVSDALMQTLAPILDGQPFLDATVVSGGEPTPTSLETLLGQASPELEPALTTADDVGFWLYTSGSTGAPKGSMHLHSDIVHTAVLYAENVLGIEADDVVFSAAKLFFAYGLGNGMTFPLHVGACAVLMAERPTPDSVMKRLKTHQATIFYGVPTLYGAILAQSELDQAAGSARLRRCVSAGEALPEGVAKAWSERFKTEILDGLGSTEMLHIFLSNRVGEVRYGTTGKAVPGYELKLVDEEGDRVPVGEMGELCVKGPSSAVAYWNQRDKSLSAFRGPWTHTGDKYVVDADGYYQYCGRTDDMLKVSGIWVSPFEVESALIEHEAVLEAAVVGQADASDLIKPKAFVILNDGFEGQASLEQGLKDFVKSRLAPYKYPRWIEFVDALPKTATGKIQRYRLRE